MTQIMQQRLNKYIATNLGISRREADEMIASGSVKLNEHIAIIGDKFNDGDKVIVGDKGLEKVEKLSYLILNKPIGYVSSRKQQNETPTIFKLLSKEHQTLKTVGRLDKDSSGLILLTNDGDFAFQYTHPKFYKIKVYELKLDRPLEPLHQQMISDYGVSLTDGKSKLTLSKLDETRKFWRVEMSEGRNRQIRRTFGALNYSVIELHRLSFGKYQLGDLKTGEWKLITK